MEEPEDELMELSEKMVQVLEGILDVPVIPTLDIDHFVMNKLSITEEKLRAKVSLQNCLFSGQRNGFLNLRCSAKL